MRIHSKGIILLLGTMIIITLFFVEGKVSYSQETEDTIENIVDKPKAIVHKYKNYLEINRFREEGITGIIINLERTPNENEIIILKELAIRGYNIYAIEGNLTNVVEDIIEKDKKNVNWILVGDVNSTEKLQEWMKKNNYKSKVYGVYEKFNNKSKTNDENIRELNNQLNSLRNEI